MLRASSLALLATLVLAAGLRLYGIDFGETNSRARPDEEMIIDRAFDLFDANSHVTQIFEGGWPEGVYRLTNWMMRLESDILDSRYGKGINLGCVYALRPLTISLPLRLGSAFFDLCSCLVMALMLRGLFPDRPTLAGVMGSLAFGCNYLAARDGHFAVSDALLTFLCLCALAFALLAVRRTPFYLTLTALFTGLAFGLKFSAIALGPLCVTTGVICLLVYPRKGRTWLWALVSLGTFAAGLLFLSPGVLEEPKAFFQGIGSHAYRFGDGARGHLIDQSYVIPPGWRFHLFTNLPIAFGKIGLVLAFVGIVIAFARNRREGLVILASLAGAFAIGLPTTAQFVRYIAPSLPALCLGLAIALTAIVEFLTDVDPGIVGTLASLAVTAAALVPPVITTYRFDHLLAAGDTRDIATTWVMEHGGGPVVSQGGWFEEVRVLGQKSARACIAALPEALAPKSPTLPPDSSDWDAAIGRGRNGWGFIAREATDHYHSVGGGPHKEAKYVLDGRGMLACGKEAKLEFSTPLEPNCFVLRDVISPGALKCDAVMDLFDAFYVPYDGFEGQVLAGPRIQIYENVCRK